MPSKLRVGRGGRFNHKQNVTEQALCHFPSTLTPVFTRTYAHFHHSEQLEHLLGPNMRL